MAVIISQVKALIDWLEYPLWVWCLIVFYFFIPVIFYIVLPWYVEAKKYDKTPASEGLSDEDVDGIEDGGKRSKLKKKRQVLIVVLGDLGHSPRMLYHAKNFAASGYKVQLFGYLNSNLPDFITDNVAANGTENQASFAAAGEGKDQIEINEIVTVASKGNKIVNLIRKVILQHWILVKLFFKQKFKNSDFVLIQNPPLLPILHILLFWKFIYSPKTKIIIDWHNLNYTILSMKFKEDDYNGTPKKKSIKQLITKSLGLFLVEILKSYEFTLTKFGDLNLTVSSNMRDFLLSVLYPITEDQKYASKKFIVLKDRPADQFAVLKDQSVRNKLITGTFAHLFQLQELADAGFDLVGDQPKDKILISSTSFTKDEDFNILLDSLKQYDQLLAKSSSNSSTTNASNKLPKIFLVVTGKGPEQEAFHARIKQLQFSQNIIIKNHWFSASEYPKIISLADLAISLHVSSSGVDLPMKILDFFGSGVPTISVKFDTIRELVRNGDNGFILNENTPACLREALVNVLSPESKQVLAKIKAGAVLESKYRWDDSWHDALAGVVA